MRKTKSYKEKKSRARAMKKAEKRAKSKATHRNTQTPRNERQRATQTPTLGIFGQAKHLFTVELMRGRKAA